MRTFGVLLDDELWPPRYYEMVYQSGGTAYLRPIDQPEADPIPVCVDEFWALT